MFKNVDFNYNIVFEDEKDKSLNLLSKLIKIIKTLKVLKQKTINLSTNQGNDIMIEEYFYNYILSGRKILISK